MNAVGAVYQGVNELKERRTGVVRNYGDMYKAGALSLRERVAEGRVRVVYRTFRRTTLTRASRTLSRRERAPAPSHRHHYKYTFFAIRLHVL